MDWLKEYVPQTESTKIIGHKILLGTKVILAKSLAPKKPKIKNNIFAISIDPKIPYKNSGCSLNKSGPGLTPWIIKPVKITAVVALPGIPKANVGTIAPPVAALFAASAPAIPSIDPFPNSSGFFDQRLASEYPIKEATVPPSAGNTPMNEPIPEDLSIVFQVSL